MSVNVSPAYVPSYHPSMFTEGGKWDGLGEGLAGGVSSMGKKCHGFMTLCWLFIFSLRRFACVCVLCVCVCVLVCGLDERHITLQMTLLDGDGPLNYSTLMQSPVNTLNQAAKEEADYPSSMPLFPPLSTSQLFLPCSPLHVCFCFICFHFFLVFWSVPPTPTPVAVPV